MDQPYLSPDSYIAEIISGYVSDDNESTFILQNKPLNHFSRDRIQDTRHVRAARHHLALDTPARDSPIGSHDIPRSSHRLCAMQEGRIPFERRIEGYSNTSSSEPAEQRAWVQRAFQRALCIIQRA
jgi:hypothetical protein